MLMPVCTISVPGPYAVVDLWQVAQSAIVGMWFGPIPIGVTPRNAVPFAVDWWQLSHAAVVGMCPVPIGFGVTPRNAVPVVPAA